MIDPSPTDQDNRVPIIAAHNVLRPLARAWDPYQAWRFAGLLGASLALHVGLYWPFQQEPAPMASIGEISISVELVLGANQHAGLLPERGAAVAASAAAAAAPEATPADTAREVVAPVRATSEPLTFAEAVTPRPVPTAPAIQAATNTRAEPPVRTVVPMEAATQPPEPAAAQALMPSPAGEIHASPTARSFDANATPAAQTELAPVQLARENAQPTPAPEQRRVEEAPPVRPTTSVPARDESADGRREIPNRRQQSPSAASAPASAAAGGVGCGRSEADDNYRGRVAAHLARHKRFPPEAQRLGRAGSATVAFVLDAGGRVTSVQLLRTSGIASLDGEAAAMVRRASPFPRPPNGHGMSFTVPVSFRIN